MSGAGATCDTSVLVPALMPWHEQHDLARRAVDSQVTSLVAHVLSETFSVGTRLPEPYRTSSTTMIGLLEALPHPVVGLSADRVRPALRRMSGFGVFGGRTYDGLIHAAAVEHGLTLLTLDKRARKTYDALGENVRMLG
ncbi:PIN domain-containing protein [Nocardioides dilutus]